MTSWTYYLCADAAAAPSRERVSLSWVTSIDRLFWKPVLTPVLHGSLRIKIHEKSFLNPFRLFLVVKSRNTNYLCHDKSKFSCIICFHFLIQIKQKNYNLVKIHWYICVIRSSAFCLLKLLFFNLCTNVM